MEFTGRVADLAALAGQLRLVTEGRAASRGTAAWMLARSRSSWPTGAIAPTITAPGDLVPVATGRASRVSGSRFSFSTTWPTNIGGISSTPA